ncbi:SRPBCC family protein [Streptomyces sp. NPDC047981]|uniref:SRPBCC family protein n=1 Tax=Streptomyces sp. NPDC047981 TaxID=3154610 RepID=UPI003442B80D
MVHATIKVNAPVREVYDQWTQFEDFPRFMDDVEEVRQLDERVCHWRTRIAGATREFETEIVDQRPDERISWRTIGGEVRQQGMVTFQALDEETTRVTLTMDVDPEGVTETAGLALGVVDSRIKGDLNRFKEFIEGRDRATGGWRGKLPPRGSTPGPPPAGEGQASSPDP